MVCLGGHVCTALGHRVVSFEPGGVRPGGRATARPPAAQANPHLARRYLVPAQHRCVAEVVGVSSMCRRNQSKIYTVCNLTMCEMRGVWGTGEFTVNFTTFTYGEFHQKCEFMVKFTMCENHQRDFTFCKIQTKCEKYVIFTPCVALPSMSYTTLRQKKNIERFRKLL